MFVGEAVAFEALAFANLRDACGAAAAEEGRSAGAALSVLRRAAQPPCREHRNRGLRQLHRHRRGRRDERLRVLLESQGAPKDQPVLALGSKGKLRGAEYEVIGFLRRRTLVEGVEYAWREYLLLGAAAGTSAG